MHSLFTPTMIIDNKQRTASSGNFEINSHYKQSLCGNNPTGHVYTANPCGYWNNVEHQFDSGVKLKKTDINTGSLYPHFEGNNRTSPSNRVVFGYARIGDDYLGR
jgi:hypothetical protein